MVNHKPAIIATHKSTKVTIVIDVTIRNESTLDHVASANKENVSKYEPLRSHYMSQEATSYSVVPLWWNQPVDRYTQKHTPFRGGPRPYSCCSGNTVAIFPTTFFVKLNVFVMSFNDGSGDFRTPFPCHLDGAFIS